jgi:hypothetical protein
MFQGWSGDREEPQLYHDQPLHGNAAKGVKPEVAEEFMSHIQQKMVDVYNHKQIQLKQDSLANCGVG